MAIRLPTPEAAGLGNVQRASGATGGISAQAPVNDFMGRQLQEVGRAAANLAVELQNRKDETSLLEAQQAWNDKRQEWLDPQTGLFARRNGDAIGATDAIAQASAQYAEELQGQFGGLSNDGRSALTQFLEGEQQRLYERAASHELTQGYAYENAMLEAAIQSEAQRGMYAVGTPGADTEISASLLRAGGQIDSWLTNQGIDPDSVLGQQMRKGKMTEHILGVASAQAALDPIGAQSFVDANSENLDPASVAAWNAQNQKAVVTHKANQATSVAFGIDRGVAEGAVPVRHSTNVELAMGPDRPHKPGDRILNVVGTAAQDVLGPGATVKVTSGKDDGDNDSNNSPRHLSGDAVDVQFFRPDGSRVEINDPEFKALAKAAANRGALGIGFGMEYMGSAMHIDMFDAAAANARLVAAGRAPAYGPAWGSGGNAMEQELVAAMEAAEGLSSTEYNSGWEYVMSIEDPNVRAAAIDKYQQQANFTYRQMDQQSAQTANELMTQAYEAYQNGEQIDVASLVEPYAGILGSRIDSVTGFLNSLASGEMVQNDGALFNELARMGVSADPTTRQEFASMDIRATYSHKLDADTITQLETMQRSIIRDGSGESRDPGTGLQFYSHDEVTDLVQPLLNTVDSDDRAQLSTTLYAALEGYQQSVFAGEKRRPTRREMELEARRLMRSKVPQFNPSGWQFTKGRNKEFTKVLEDADSGTLNDLLQVDDLVLQYDIGGGQVVNHRVSPTEISNAISAWREVYGVDPAPSNVIQLLQQYPPRPEELNIAR